MKRRILVLAGISVLLLAALAANVHATEVKITASDGAAFDYFGMSVAISGDYAVVSTLYGDGAGVWSGSAYIFKRDGTAWTEQAKITASDGAAEDYFGRSVAISGDYAVVGAYGDDDAGTNSGSAYIFKRDGTAWTEQAKITASDGAADDYFGRSVAISGDYAVVGAYGDDDAGTKSGSAYIFKCDGTAWTEQAKITASDGTADDSFGYSVAISGDYAVMGAEGDDDAGVWSGSAYIFKRNGTAWTEQAKITASDGGVCDQFGWSVAISGDYAVVGASGNDDTGTDSGSAYIFKCDGTAWTEQAKITASDGAEGDRFGDSVAISGDYAVVGAYHNDDAGSDSGSAYIFKCDGTAWTEQAKITASDGAEGDRFGDSVAISGDYAVVGAYHNDDAGSDSGSAYIFKCDGTAWTEQAKITASDGAAEDYFGDSVAISGDYAIVGAPYDDDAGSNSGSAYIYTIGVIPTPTDVSISTDCFEYSPGDTIICHLEIDNPTANPVTFNWYLRVPQFAYWGTIASAPIPAGTSYSDDLPFPVGDWGPAPFGMVWYVELTDGTGKVLDSDTAICAYSPGVTVSRTSDAVGAIEESIREAGQ